MTAKSTMSYFRGSFIFAAIALVLGAAVGFVYGGGLTGALNVAIYAALQSVMLVAVLGVMETSLSFDNAVVNATVLQNWDDKWRRRFLTWGIFVAVFVMRFFFPIAIVAVTTKLWPWDVVSMATFEPAKYATLITAAHLQVSFFGAPFLTMVGLEFFFKEKDHKWLSWIEAPLEKAGSMRMIEAGVTLAIILVLSLFLPAAEQVTALVSGIVGLVTYIVVKGLGEIIGGGEEGVGGKVVRASIGGFLYLEVLDASFSFDGVIGAFALTNNLWIILLGLTVGSFFVRSFTIYLVNTGKLAELRYLEHGAFYAIIALAGIMFASGLGAHIPEWFTGLIGAGFIGVAALHSVHANKQDAKAEALAA